MENMLSSLCPVDPIYSVRLLCPFPGWAISVHHGLALISSPYSPLANPNCREYFAWEPTSSPLNSAVAAEERERERDKKAVAAVNLIHTHQGYWNSWHQEMRRIMAGARWTHLMMNLLQVTPWHLLSWLLLTFGPFAKSWLVPTHLWNGTFPEKWSPKA